MYTERSGPRCVWVRTTRGCYLDSGPSPKNIVETKPKRGKIVSDGRSVALTFFQTLKVGMGTFLRKVGEGKKG